GRMNRLPSLVAACILSGTAWSGFVLAQTPAAPAPPAQGAPAPGGAQGQPPARGALPPVVTGPSAPVPPEVTIPRPTPEELAKANDPIKKWIDADKSATKPLLQKFQPLMLLQPPRLNVAATYTQTGQRMGPRHEGFVEIAKRGNIDLLLDGDSITDFWV